MTYTSDPIVFDPPDSLYGAAVRINSNFSDIAEALSSIGGGSGVFDYGKTALSGGGASALDGIDGADLSGGEWAVVIVGDNPAATYFYVCDPDNGGAESVPYIITPDTNAGTKRWVLSARGKRLWPASGAPTVNDDETTGVLAGDLWTYANDLWVCIDATDGAAVWVQVIKIGTTSTTACAGNDSRLPTSDQKAALAGTSGTPSSTNKFVTNDDSRNTNARTPTAHGSAQHSGTIGGESQVTFDNTTGHSHNGTNSTMVDHVNLLNKGSNAHSVIDSHLSASAPHSGHEVTSAKNAASGYCPLDSNVLVPTANLGSGTANSTKVLYGDQTWKDAPTGGSGSGSYAFSMMLAR